MRGKSIQHIMVSYQRNEITEYHIYKRIAKSNRSVDNRKILLQIAE